MYKNHEDHLGRAQKMGESLEDGSISPTGAFLLASTIVAVHNRALLPVGHLADGTIAVTFGPTDRSQTDDVPQAELSAPKA
jgi:hypothetical protein